MADQASACTSSACRLVKALENVILPIINAHVPGLAAKEGTVNVFQDGDDSRLEPTAQQLVSALESFITALLCPQILQQSTNESDEAFENQGNVPTIVNTSALDINLSIAEVPQSQTTPEQSRFQEEAIKQAHYHVFNKMPIRVLSFKSDGSGIELLERSTVFSRISTAIKSDLYEANADSIEEVILKHTKYAILSHTWLRDLPGEVRYADWKAREFDHGSPGHQKLVHFCRTAAMDHKVTFGWMDTVCINKDSSAELDESIRSMYTWYADASICITYLAETTSLHHMHHDSWFTRGWTLQELLAPQSIEFYGANWQKLHQTDGIGSEIHVATGISQDDHRSFRKSRHNIPISKRMKWAANRHVTREEDVAYSLMGIFDVSLSIAYGEGSERAFIRLLREMMNLAGVSTLDILNWGSGSNSFLGTSSAMSSVIPSSPKQYLARSGLDIHWPTPGIPVTLTHLGLHVSVLLMPAISVDPHPRGALQWVPIGNFYTNVAYIELLGQKEFYKFGGDVVPVPTRYNVLDKTSISCANCDGWGILDARFRLIFGLLNFVDNGHSVTLPSFQNLAFPNVPPDANHSYGFALCFTMTSGTLRRIQTSRPATLDINSLQIDNPNDFRTNRYEIRKSELKEHGIELHTLYL